MYQTKLPPAVLICSVIAAALTPPNAAAQAPASAEKACEESQECRSTEYCRFEAGTCGERGVCTPKPEICPMLYAPVCGCDGKTYSNSCAAAAKGVSVRGDGECPGKGSSN